VTYVVPRSSPPARSGTHRRRHGRELRRSQDPRRAKHPDHRRAALQPRGRGGLAHILLNFSNVEYLSSAALGKLITLNKKLGQAGGKLILCNISPEILEVFEITKLDKFFKIRKEEQAALQEF